MAAKDSWISLSGTYEYFITGVIHVFIHVLNYIYHLNGRKNGT